MKLIRAYVITVIACLSIFSAVACFFIADENAKKISLGEESAVVVMNNSHDALENNATNPLPLIKKIAEETEKAASIAPPPFGNIYWFIQGIKRCQK